MYWLWKWLESYNNCTFSTWKDIFVFSLLFWIPNSFCTFHDYGRGGTPFLASPDGRHWFFIIHIFEQLSCPEKQSCPEIFHCVEIFFIFQDFWATCGCPEKQSVPWIHCMEDVFLIIQNLEQLALALKNRVCPEIFHCVEIFFICQDFRGTCVCPENRVCMNSLYLIYIFYHSEFWTTCACPEKHNFPWNFSLYWNIFYLSGYLSNLSLPWIFQAGGRPPPPPCMPLVFDTQCWEIAKTNHSFLVVLFSHLNMSIVSCTDKDVCNLVANTLFCLDFNDVCQVLLHILEIPLCRDAGSDRLHSVFNDVVTYCSTCLIVFPSCSTFEWQRRILVMWLLTQARNQEGHLGHLPPQNFQNIA